MAHIEEIAYNDKVKTLLGAYVLRAVGLRTPAMRGEACLRGLYRIIFSKTITSARALRALMDAHAAEPAPRQLGFVPSARTVHVRADTAGWSSWGQSAARPMRRCGC